ncbi:hypothetical protein ACQ5SP_06720 [Rhodovulum sp. YNF3179]|uniref:hypothetical protein n=1 Tax=Rhodovulum sp. YNF3179 TaxID=3425127 RepID=UPI003D339EDC
MSAFQERIKAMAGDYIEILEKAGLPTEGRTLAYRSPEDRGLVEVEPPLRLRQDNPHERPRVRVSKRRSGEAQDIAPPDSPGGMGHNSRHYADHANQPEPLSGRVSEPKPFSDPWFAQRALRYCALIWKDLEESKISSRTVANTALLFSLQQNWRIRRDKSNIELVKLAELFGSKKSSEISAKKHNPNRAPTHVILEFMRKRILEHKENGKNDRGALREAKKDTAKEGLVSSVRAAGELWRNHVEKAGATLKGDFLKADPPDGWGAIDTAEDHVNYVRRLTYKNWIDLRTQYVKPGTYSVSHPDGDFWGYLEVLLDDCEGAEERYLCSAILNDRANPTELTLERAAELFIIFEKRAFKEAYGHLYDRAAAELDKKKVGSQPHNEAMKKGGHEIATAMREYIFGPEEHSIKKAADFVFWHNGLGESEEANRRRYYRWCRDNGFKTKPN